MKIIKYNDSTFTIVTSLYKDNKMYMNKFGYWTEWFATQYCVYSSINECEEVIKLHYSKIVEIDFDEPNE